MPLPGAQLSHYRRDAEVHVQRTDGHAHELLARFEQQAAAAGVPFTGLHARHNVVDLAIVAQAEESGCDLIVMATHGRGKFGELLFGSHTRNVLSRCKLPLLVLH